MQQQLVPASSYGLQQLQQQLVTASSNSLQQQQLAPANSSFMQQQQHLQPCSLLQEHQSASATPNTGCSSPVKSTRMTRARKKIEALSPADSVAIEQVDGADPSPPPSPAALQSPPTPDLVSPPPPPPWSKYLPSHQCNVICGRCLAGCHGLGFIMCQECHLKIVR